MMKRDTFGMRMGWINDNDDNDNPDNGVRIDWDIFDKINRNNNTIEDKSENRGTIEVPANAETIIYESPDGETYEIPLSDLIEADDDGEIKYESKSDFTVKKANNKNTPHKYNKQDKYNIRRFGALMNTKIFAYVR